MTDITAIITGDITLTGNAGSLEELVQAYVEAAVANLGAGNLAWSVVTAPAVITANAAYAVNGLSLISLDLPVAPLNSRLILYAYSLAGWRLQQVAPNDRIQIGDVFTTMGPSGRISSLGQGSCIELTRLPDRWVGNVLQGHVEVL